MHKRHERTEPYTDIGESFIQCAYRELKEEAGLVLHHVLQHVCCGDAGVAFTFISIEQRRTSLLTRLMLYSTTNHAASAGSHSKRRSGWTISCRLNCSNNTESQSSELAQVKLKGLNMSGNIIIQNAGELPIWGMRLLGLSNKNSGQIGKFGTGLKESIALLARMGVSPIIFSGTCRIDFSTQSIDGQQELCFMLSEQRARFVENEWHGLGLHPNFGKSDWADPWMVFRELICNAIDESGSKVCITTSPTKSREGKKGRRACTCQRSRVWSKHTQQSRIRYSISASTK